MNLVEFPFATLSDRSDGVHVLEFQGENVRDVRRCSIKYAGYAVGFRGGHVQVRIDLPQYRELKAWFEEQATRRSAERLAKAFYDLPFEPYYLVRRQEFHMLRAVARRRKAAGLPLVPKECIWLKRRPVKPFGDPHGGAAPGPTCERLAVGLEPPAGHDKFAPDCHVATPTSDPTSTVGRPRRPAARTSSAARDGRPNG